MSLPQIITGDLWSEIGQADVIAVTTNCVIKHNGALAMGAGSAKEMVDRYAGIDRHFGHFIQELGREYWTTPGSSSDQSPPKAYGFLISRDHFFVPKVQRIEDIQAPITRMAIFQTKYHYRAASDLDLIRYSCQRLAGIHRGQRVAIPYPGIGFGGLEEKDVYPILMAELPPEIVIYRR